MVKLTSHFKGQNISLRCDAFLENSKIRFCCKTPHFSKMEKKSLKTHALKSRINDFRFLRGCFDGLFDNAFSSNWGFAAESRFASTGYFIHLANSLRDAKRFEEAVSAYKKAIQREPNNIFAHLNLAGTYIMMAREEEARAEAAEVLRINPKFTLEF